MQSTESKNYTLLWLLTLKKKVCAWETAALNASVWGRNHTEITFILPFLHWSRSTNVSCQTLEINKMFKKSGLCLLPLSRYGCFYEKWDYEYHNSCIWRKQLTCEFGKSMTKCCFKQFFKVIEMRSWNLLHLMVIFCILCIGLTVSEEGLCFLSCKDQI